MCLLSSPGRGGRWLAFQNKGGVQCSISGPLLAQFPQTSQAAEYAAYTIAAQCGDEGSHMFSDCQNV
eukprot:8212228-Pyramimonas_sp.AAC.1